MINRTSYARCLCGCGTWCVCEAVLLHAVFVGDLHVNVKIVLILSYMKCV